MGLPEGTEQMLTAKFEAILPHLNERQRRLLLGAEARSLGHGGIRAVARAAGTREATVAAGADELEAGLPPLGRVRRPGGGRKPLTQTDPGLPAALLALVEPDERGDPGSPLRWTTKSLRHLAGELTRQGHTVSTATVAALLKAEGFSLQGTAKTIEGRQHRDRDAQFRHIYDQVHAWRGTGDPVISVDAKKKERVGHFLNPGREWRPAGRPAAAYDHEVPGQGEGVAIPYGIYDLATGSGWVNVGTDHNTAAFAVESIRRWWDGTGRWDHPHARRLLITADAGGSNGYRTRAWIAGLAELALASGLAITVCHFPPGTSKWNAIEHRLFSCITTNWRGRPLTSHQVIVQTIAATTTGTGLRVHAELDPGHYPTGVSITDDHWNRLPIQPQQWHGEWNYTLLPQPLRPPPDPPPKPPTPPKPPAKTAPPPPAPPPVPGSRDDHAWSKAWIGPALTGMSDRQWQHLLTSLTIPAQARHQARLFIARGRPATRPATGRPPALDLADH